MDESNYEDLAKMVDFYDFTPTRWYIEEDTIIKPQLITKGFLDPTFHTLSRNENRPTKRGCRVIDLDGSIRFFSYDVVEE